MNMKYFKLLFLLFIFLLAYLLMHNISFENKIIYVAKNTYKDYYDGQNLTESINVKPITDNLNNKILDISELNQAKKELDSNASHTDTSTLEFNYRKYELFNPKSDLNNSDALYRLNDLLNYDDCKNIIGANNCIKGIEKDTLNPDVTNANGTLKYGTLEGTIDSKEFYSYPRLLKLNNPNDYKYVLVFQSTQNRFMINYSDAGSYNSNTNGIDIYYTRSNDLFNWTKPERLFKSNYNDENQKIYSEFTKANIYYLYYGDELLEYKDENGEDMLMALSCKISYKKWQFAKNESSLYNNNGIYIRKSADGGRTWSNEEKIYTGHCYDAAAIQLDSGEIQVYMTHIAPIWYMQSIQANNGPNNYFALNSSVHNSSGVGMISSIDYGKTFSPNVTGTDKTYYDLSDGLTKNVRNPYSAYRVAQEYWTDKYTNIADIDDNYDNKIRFTTPKTDASGNTIPFYFEKYQNDFPNSPLVHGIEDKNNNNKIFQMIDGMTGPIVLNNKKMVLPLESGGSYLKKASNNKFEHGWTCSISLAYSNLNPVNVNGVTKQKYWLDINNKTKNESANNAITYNNENEVYASEGLALDEVGPINREERIIETASGPDLVQFPSGETLLSYHLNPNIRIKMGDANGTFERVYGIDVLDKTNLNDIELACGEVNAKSPLYVSGKTQTPQNYKMVNGDTICVEGNSYWAGLSIIDPHEVVLIRSFKADNNGNYVTSDNNFTKAAITFSPFYLNHTLEIKKNDDSPNEALFIGSESQAQTSIRINYDTDNIYIYADTLDKNVTTSDSVELYLRGNGLKYNNATYDYLHIIVNSNNNSIINLVKGSNTQTLNIVKTETKVLNTMDNNGGYLVKVTIPRNALNLTDNNLKINAILNNCDNTTCDDNTIIKDVIAGTNISDASTWIDINLLSLMNGDVNKNGIVNDEDSSILTKYIINGGNNANFDVYYGDVNNNGTIKMNDVMKLLKQYKNPL